LSGVSDGASQYHRLMPNEVTELVARLWPGRAFEVVPLSSGITNANFMVDLGDDQVVVRIPGEHTELLGIDRRQESAANRLAASIGIAPPVLAESAEEGWLVSQFLKGRTVSALELASEPLLVEVSTTLRRVHSAGTIEKYFDPFTIVRDYHRTAQERGVAEPFDYLGALSVLERIEAVRPFRPTRFCHNDLLNGNFLYDERLRILDWEYAGMGDPMFDLASLSVNHAFTPESDEQLLRHYFGRSDDGLLAVLALMKPVSELRETMWGVVQLAVSTLDVDFAAYAGERAQRFTALLEAMDFDELLAIAGSVVSDPDH
jgi:thiamine kinase-like enzyme